MDIDGLHIEVERKGIKHIHLAVYPPDGRVHVSAPDYLSDTDIEAFVLQKFGWIVSKREEVMNQPRQSQRHYLSGESHYLFGLRMTLRVVEDAKCTPSVSKIGERLVLTVRPGTGEMRRRELVTEWQREHLREYLQSAVEHWRMVMNEAPVTWQIKQLRAEWGSCMALKRTLLFNLELSRVPVECVDYIVVHELCHLKVQNHSRLFEKHLECYMPNWRERRQQLNDFIALYKADIIEK